MSYSNHVAACCAPPALARWHGDRQHWYVPAGFSLAPFAEWLTRAADAADEPTWFEYDMADLRERQAKIKGLGGRFDKERRRWYVPAGLSLTPFREYLRAPAHRDVMNAL